MTIAEKLIELDKNADTVITCNEQLTQILAGTDTGAKGYYDFFWDNFQDYGNRTNYYCAFLRWSGFEYIRPKYKVIPTEAGGGYNIIYRCPNLKKVEAAYFDLSQVPYGTSNAQSFAYLFGACYELEEIEDIGLQPNCSYDSFCTSDAKLRKVACVRLDKNTIVNNMFYSCLALEEVIFEGEIGQSGINLYKSKNLNRASIKSLIYCLSKDVEGKSITLSKAAVDKAFETSAEANDGSTSSAWQALTKYVSNWTISLL